MPGPRFEAASWVGTVGMAEPEVYDFPGSDGRAFDPESVSRFVGEMADLRVDIVKLPPSGGSAVVKGTSRIVRFTDDEVAAAAAVARERGVALTTHARAAESIKMAVRHGIRAVHHCTLADEEALDLLEATRDRLFVAPTPGIIYAISGPTPSRPGGSVRPPPSRPGRTRARHRRRFSSVSPWGGWAGPWTAPAG